MKSSVFVVSVWKINVQYEENRDRACSHTFSGHCIWNTWAIEYSCWLKGTIQHLVKSSSSSLRATQPQSNRPSTISVHRLSLKSKHRNSWWSNTCVNTACGEDSSCTGQPSSLQWTGSDAGAFKCLLMLIRVTKLSCACIWTAGRTIRFSCSHHLQQTEWHRRGQVLCWPEGAWLLSHFWDWNT